MALCVCPTPGCPELTTGGRCAECRAEAERKRGTANARGYGRKHRQQFRERVLKDQPLCVCTDTAHGHSAPCGAISRHADHHPHGRDELIALGLNPNDPRYGRGLCWSCHSKATAANPAQRGGWNIR